MSTAHAQARHGRANRALRIAAALAVMLSLFTATLAQAVPHAQAYPTPAPQPSAPPADAPRLAQAPVTPHAAPPIAANGSVTYRGFTIDVSAIRGSPQYDTIMQAVTHQVDITADCGAKPEIQRFFQSQVVHIQPLPTGGTGPGRFNPQIPGVTIVAVSLAPQKPILLHELLHAYHYRVMAGGFRNPDVLTFYNRARSNGHYPRNAYMLKNVQEFFAVTGSLYLWGSVDRPPRTRAALRAAQPAYYAWLGRLFGVTK